MVSVFPQTQAGSDFRFARPLDSEAGGLVIFFAILVLAILAFAGLAIDSGNLYRAQLAAQNAADSTAVAIVNYISMRGKNSVEEEAYGQTRPTSDQQLAQKVTTHLAPQVEQLARANMEAQGFPHTPKTIPSENRAVTVSSQYRTLSLIPAAFRNSRSFEYEVSVTRNVDYLLIDLIPFIHNKYSQVEAHSVAVRKVADIVLVLDVSGSLRCPAIGPCTCQTSEVIPCDTKGDSRYHRLIDAVKEFLRYFDLDKDRISFSLYNLAGRRFTLQEIRGFLGMTGPITVEQTEQIAAYFLDNFSPGNATNICDGLMQAFAATTDLHPPAENPSYVLFSDGAPTAGRFLFTEDSAKSKLDKNNLGVGLYDYDLYTVSWIKNVDPQTRQTNYLDGPSLLVDSSALRSRENGLFGVPLTNPAELPNSASRRCKNDRTRAYPVTNAADLMTAIDKNFDECLDSFEAHLPGDIHRKYGSEYSPTAPTLRFRDWRKQYYHCAIEMSDYIREVGGGSFFAIGLGEPNPLAPVTDAYQLVDDSIGRKDIFLARLAMDLQEANKFTAPDASGKPQRIKFDYKEYRDITQLPENASRRSGVYLPTTDATKLQLLFQQIARKILLKMVE